MGVTMGSRSGITSFILEIVKIKNELSDSMSIFNWLFFA